VEAGMHRGEACAVVAHAAREPAAPARLARGLHAAADNYFALMFGVDLASLPATKRGTNCAYRE
jgi:hypothetical protein